MARGRNDLLYTVGQLDGRPMPWCYDSVATDCFRTIVVFIYLDFEERADVWVHVVVPRTRWQRRKMLLAIDATRVVFNSCDSGLYSHWLVSYC